jgi:hypothetical protein
MQGFCRGKVEPDVDFSDTLVSGENRAARIMAAEKMCAGFPA